MTAARLSGFGQQELAARIGANRRWVIDVEKGKPRAEVGMILRALDALGVELTIWDERAFPERRRRRRARHRRRDRARSKETPLMTELVVDLQDREVGTVSRDRHGRAVFTYADDWREARESYPLSLSMPLAQREHDHRRVEPYLWGLLPDNELILERWARRFQVSAPERHRTTGPCGQRLRRRRAVHPSWRGTAAG